MLTEQAAQVRSEGQAIDRDLAQPFFAWLSEREGADGRPIGAAGAANLISVQTAEDAETLREHAAAFIAEKFPAPAGPDPASFGGVAAYEAAAGEVRTGYGRETAAAHAGWSAGVRDRAGAAGAPRPGDVPEDAIREGARAETDMIVRGSAREAKTDVTRGDALEGRAGVAAERDKAFERHATENLPLIGGWLAGKLFGTARNAAPDGAEGQPRTIPTPDWKDQSP